MSLKERYRIGKKQKSWRSQIYIKLTRSNDDDSRKHPLKYFCLKCHIWWEINNLTSRLEFIAQWAFYSFLFWHRCNAKFVIGFSLFSRDPDGRLISNFYRFVSLCIDGGLHKVLTLPATVLLAKTNSVMFLPKRSKYQVTIVCFSVSRLDFFVVFSGQP